MGKFTVDHRASEVTQCLEMTWAALRRCIKGLPKATVIPLDVTGRRRRRGHFAPDGWRRRDGGLHEVADSPWLFGRPADLLCTLVHEAVHAILHEVHPAHPKHNAGCSRSDPYYHRKEFK